MSEEIKNCPEEENEKDETENQTDQIIIAPAVRFIWFHPVTRKRISCNSCHSLIKKTFNRCHPMWNHLPLGSTNQPPPPRKNLQPKYSVSKASVKSVRCCKGSVSSLSGFFS